MTQVAEVKQKQRYKEQEVQRALIEIAACGGNTRMASKHLAEEGLDIPHPTLWCWKAKVHAEKYELIREEQLPKIRRYVADLHIAGATRRMETADELMDALAAKKDELEARDLSSAIRNLDVGAGIHSQNAEKLNDQPAIKTAHDFGGMLREFKQMTGIEVQLSVPDEEPVVDAQVVDEPSIPATDHQQDQETTP
jgi:hypothetical protein